MATESGAGVVFCRDCGAEIDERAEICPECGVRQQDRAETRTGSAFDQYSIVTWLASIIFGLLTFPIGLVIPAYFAIKATRSEPPNQTPLEVWTVILLGVFGIAAVEVGGRRGAKVLWAIVIGLFALGILLGMLMMLA